jgi:hypothetical protein
MLLCQSDLVVGYTNANMSVRLGRQNRRSIPSEAVKVIVRLIKVISVIIVMVIRIIRVIRVIRVIRY